MSLGQLPLLTRGTFALFYGEEETKISLTFTNLKKTNVGGEEIIEQLSVLPPGGRRDKIAEIGQNLPNLANILRSLC